MPFAPCLTRYSYALCKYLFHQDDIEIQFDSLENDEALKELLAITLPASEREYASADLNAESFFNTLALEKKEVVTFLLQQIELLPNNLLVREQYWQRLTLFLHFQPQSEHVSIPFNRLRFSPTYYDEELLRRFSVEEWMRRPLPEPRTLKPKQFIELIRVIRYSMFLTLRETDPASFMQEETLQYI